MRSMALNSSDVGDACDMIKDLLALGPGYEHVLIIQDFENRVWMLFLCRANVMTIQLFSSYVYAKNLLHL